MIESVEIGHKVKPNGKYFMDIGDASVFTRGKAYDVVEVGYGRGIGPNIVAGIVDDSGVLRHINADYLDGEFSDGDNVKFRGMAFLRSNHFTPEKVYRVIDTRDEYAYIEDDLGSRRPVHVDCLVASDAEETVKI